MGSGGAEALDPDDSDERAALALRVSPSLAHAPRAAHAGARVSRCVADADAMADANRTRVLAAADADAIWAGAARRLLLSRYDAGPGPVFPPLSPTAAAAAARLRDSDDGFGVPSTGPPESSEQGRKGPG